MDVVCFLSAVCPVCWSSSFVSLIDKIPSSDYLTISRKSSEWTPSDQQRKHAVTDAIVRIISETLNTCFGMYSPQYLRTVYDPDGFNFHSRMHNDNGKCAIEYLILVSLHGPVQESECSLLQHCCARTDIFEYIEPHTSRGNHKAIQQAML